MVYYQNYPYSDSNHVEYVPSANSLENNSSIEPYNVSLVLSRVEKVVSVLETGLPYLVEYAPVMRNIPKIYALLKAFNDETKS